MSDDINIKKIAKLARIEINETDEAELATNITDILSYVGSVKKVADEAGSPEAGPVRNVLREDTDPHEPGEYRDALLREAPSVDGDGYIVVPPIL
jgi:aspartyl-tRNA(Asn)/glutamyl-tRNA(Gln) amidotransferase subunit C